MHTTGNVVNLLRGGRRCRRAAGILGFMFLAYYLGDPRLLGYAANAMAFTVGWHYVKQGYGVIAVLSAIRRIYYSEIEKRLLLVNGYVVWIHSWLQLNTTLHEEKLYGVKFFTVDMPPMLLTVGTIAAGLTTAAVVVAFAVRILVRKQAVSWNGIVGYVCALYLWSLAFYYDLIFAIFIPAFHSLQYLLFTWRYQLNKVSCEAGPGTPAPAEKLSRPALVRFSKFVGWGLVLGWIGFTGLPLLFHASLSPDPTLLGPAVFVFIFVMWINIHHCFIDNVIWRRDNESFLSKLECGSWELKLTPLDFVVVVVYKVRHAVPSPSARVRRVGPSRRTSQRATADRRSSRAVHPGRHRAGWPLLQRQLLSVPRPGR